MDQAVAVAEGDGERFCPPAAGGVGGGGGRLLYCRRPVVQLGIGFTGVLVLPKSMDANLYLPNMEIPLPVIC